VKVPHRAAPYHQRVRNIGGAFTDPEFEDASHLDDDDGSLNRRLPRRRQLVARAEGFETPPMRTELKFVIQRRLVLQRLWVIAIAFNRYFLSNIWYGIRQRDSEKKRAVRLRLAIERIGGSAIKIGQQMAIRVDLLPYAYTEELNKLLDKVPPFPKEYAIERLQALTGKPLEETFQAIDLDNPIGAASVSCVYQAVLLNGDRVAINIRRPGIGKQFTADIHAMRWAAWLLETLTILRTGMAKNVIEEFGGMLLDELNFVHEARHARIFTKYTKKAKIDYVSAPYTYPELSSHDVLTAELIQGIPMTDIISAVEQENTEALRRLEALDIDPVRLAKRFLRLSHFNLFENVLFHADPHPANVLVRPHDHIVLIDFGSCGAYTHKERHKWRQLALCHLTDDVSGMVQAGLSILEPMPGIDIDEFTKKMEKVFWKDLYAFEDPHSEWWEHTSANIWLSFLSMAREYNLTINLNTLRMIRATLLYDTVAARLFKDIDAYKADSEH